ncbi:MAG: aminotransferase class V-fold PLP-dependent enzyme [Bacteroidetes bacterium]|nr:MAG: aminotransferase class V-fold PLP-dependent enzyme [Bacteroidota bacterium]
MNLDILKKTFQIAEYFLEEDKKNPVLTYKSPQDLSKDLDININSEGVSENIFFESLEKIVLATPKTGSRSFFNQLFGGRNSIAISGEILASIMNNSMYTYKVGGAQILLEKEVVSQMLRKVGYEGGDGTFAPGGSMTNMIAMIAARNEKDPNIKDLGFSGKKMTLYTSIEGHYSIPKNAGMIGMGRNNVKNIASDKFGKMDINALRNQIIKDKNEGSVPFMINATAGTTVLGAFDPFDEIADIAKEFDIWFHVDGALGGSVALSKKYKKLLKGAEKSDSFSWNAHKMMCVPLTASVILFRNKFMLKRHISEKASYLFQADEDDYNPGLRSIQCGRRNDALKVWSAWKFYGHKGYEKRINRLFELAQYAVSIIKKDPNLQLIQEPESVTVCFQVKGKSNQKICDLLHKQGLAKVSYGTARGKTFVRMACVNPDLENEDIDIFFDRVRQVSNEL